LDFYVRHAAKDLTHQMHFINIVRTGHAAGGCAAATRATFWMMEIPKACWWPQNEKASLEKKQIQQRKRAASLTTDRKIALLKTQ
jgi:hypothetical protein